MSDAVADHADDLGLRLELIRLAPQRAERRDADGRPRGPEQLVADHEVRDLDLGTTDPDAADRGERDVVRQREPRDAAPRRTPAHVTREIVVVASRQREVAAYEHGDRASCHHVYARTELQVVRHPRIERTIVAEILIAPADLMRQWQFRIDDHVVAERDRTAERRGLAPLDGIRLQIDRVEPERPLELGQREAECEIADRRTAIEPHLGLAGRRRITIDLDRLGARHRSVRGRRCGKHGEQDQRTRHAHQPMIREPSS